MSRSRGWSLPIPQLAARPVQSPSSFSLFRLGLGAKLILIVVAISLVGVLASSFLLFSLQREQLIEETRLSVARLNISIKASLEHAMHSHDKSMLNAIIQQVVQETGVEQIRIINTRGEVWTSSVPSEVGQRLDTSAAQCQPCHDTRGELRPGVATSIVSGTSKHPVFFGLSPILNSPTCFECHDSQTRTLGYLIVEAPVGDLNAQMQESFVRIGFAASLTFLLLVGLMVPVLRKFVTSPVGELSKGLCEIAADNLHYQVQIPNHDELGQLAATFNAMRQHIQLSQEELEHRNEELAVLYQVALVTGQLLDLDQILAQALDTIISKLSLEAGLIYLWDETRGRFEGVVSHGLSEAQLQEIDRRRRRAGGDLTGEVADRGEVMLVQDMSTSPHFPGVFETVVARSYLNIPLKSKGKITGTMELVSRLGRPYSERQIEVLKVVGQQIGIAIDNTSLLAESRQSEREAVTLYQLGTEVTSSLDVSQVLRAVASGARQALAADIGIVGLLDEGQNEIVLRAVEGTLTIRGRGQRVSLNQTVFGPNLSEGKAINIEECAPNLSPELAGLIEAEQVKSLLLAPLWRGERLHGVVMVLTRNKRHFTQAEIQLLTRLAQQVVVAIENARLYQQVGSLAALEERDRLARELHDNLAQALGYLNLKTTITGDLLVQGQVEQAQASLRELKQITREAYTDIREAVFSLRTEIRTGAGLIPVLQEYLAEYRAHYGLDARLVVDDESLSELSAEAAIQVSRIIQEALTNVRKHASAKRAWVRCVRDDGQICIRIEDDGCGIDPASIVSNGRQHYGFQIMGERAESVGGVIEFDSQPNQGTRVIIRLPVPTGK